MYKRRSKSKDLIYRGAFDQLAKTWNATGKGKESRVKIVRGGLYLADIGIKTKSIYPVVVLQTNSLNKLGYPSTIVVPCVDDCKLNNLLRVPVSKSCFPNRKAHACMIDCIRMLNNLRFRSQIGRVPGKTLLKITRRVQLLVEA